VDADFKVSSFQERLTDWLCDARVEHRCRDGLHEFVIRFAGACFKVEYSEPSLLRKSERDIELAAMRVVERIQAQRKIKAPTNALSLNR
jgi:hypothetical protein